jgi:ABC-type branched-subunit amino acid transport system substrate-binding protein
MPHHWTRCRLAVLAILVATTLTASFAVSTAGAKTHASKGTLTIAVITSVGGSVIDFPQIPAAIIAGVRAINKEGGINGYKLGVFYCNTKNLPDQEVACARQAVDKHVVAAVGGFILTNPQGYFQTLHDANIADVGQQRSSIQSLTFSNSFPLIFSDAAFIGCLSPAVIKATGTKYSLLANDSAIAQPVVDLINQTTATQKLPSSQIIRYPLTATDFTPFAQQMSGSSLIIGSTTPPQAVAFLNASKSLGQNSAFCTNQGVGAASAPWVQLGNQAGNIYVGFNELPITEAPHNKMLQKFESDMKAEQARGDQNAAIDPTTFNGLPLQGWLALQAFKQVVAGMKGPVNNVTFLAAIAKAKLKMGGVIPNIDFTKCEAAGPYTRVFNWVAQIAKWDVKTQQFDLLPHSQFDAVRYAYGTEHQGAC